MSLLGVLHGHRRGLWCCEFSPSDEILATASADATIKLWTLSDFNNVAVSFIYVFLFYYEVYVVSLVLITIFCIRLISILS